MLLLHPLPVAPEAEQHVLRHLLRLLMVGEKGAREREDPSPVLLSSRLEGRHHHSIQRRTMKKGETFQGGAQLEFRPRVHERRGHATGRPTPSPYSAPGRRSSHSWTR